MPAPCQQLSRALADAADGVELANTSHLVGLMGMRQTSSPRVLMMRLRASHLLIVGAIALVVLAMAAFVQTSKQEPAREHPAGTTRLSRLGSVAPKLAGRERCMRKCALVQKGYLYAAEQHRGGPETPIVQPEVCTCI